MGPTRGEVAVSAVGWGGVGDAADVVRTAVELESGFGMPGKEILCKPGKVARVENTDASEKHSSLPRAVGEHTLLSRGVRS